MRFFFRCLYPLLTQIDNICSMFFLILEPAGNLSARAQNGSIQTKIRKKSLSERFWGSINAQQTVQKPFETENI